MRGLVATLALLCCGGGPGDAVALAAAAWPGSRPRPARFEEVLPLLMKLLMEYKP